MRVLRRRKEDAVSFMLVSLRQTSEEFYALRDLNKKIGRSKSEIIRHALAVAFPDTVFPTFEQQDAMKPRRPKRSRRSAS